MHASIDFCKFFISYLSPMLYDRCICSISTIYKSLYVQNVFANLRNIKSVVTVKLGIGGFSTGAAIALYSASCYAYGRYGNSTLYPVNLSAVIGLSGWLPCSRTLKYGVECSQVAARRAASLPLLVCHGRGDDMVLYKHGERSAEALRSSGFRNLTFKTYNGLGHYTVPEEMEDVCKWLNAWMGLDRSRS